MGEKVTVLHMVNGEFYAGAERVQDLLALRLPEFGFRVTFACVKAGIFAERRMCRDAEVFAMPMRSRIDLGLAFRLARLAKACDCRLIHTHTVRTALLGHLVSRISGLPMIHHVHSPTGEDTEAGWRNLRNALSERISLGRSSRLIPVSGRLEDHLVVERGFWPGRVTTVWNGVPMREKTRRRREPGEPLVLGMVALFRPRKGIEVLLAALSRLRGEGFNVRLHAVGPFETQDYRREIAALVAELDLEGCIEWTGFSADVASEYEKMHVFVLPSLYGEGMPMVVLEAMSVGLPVVSTRVEGIPEVVRHGREGLLVEPGDSEALASALRMLASAEVDGGVLGDSGWLRQRETFSDLAMARGVAAVYREIMDQQDERAGRLAGRVRA